MTEKEKLERIEMLVNEDELYQRMLEEFGDLEREFDAVIGKLSIKRRGLVWDFVMACEEMSNRKLVIACRNMDFRK